MEGLCKVNADRGLRAEPFASERGPLDMDACLVETHKQEALHSYKRYRAYQPLTTYWQRPTDCAFGVSGRQRTCGPSAVASVD